MRDFPKIHCPFVRVRTEDNRYLAIDEVNAIRDEAGNVVEDYSWVFDPDQCRAAVDKIDGTNVCLHVREGKIAAVSNRGTEKPIFAVKQQTRWEGACLEGLSECIKRGWIQDAYDMDIFGELVGPIINGNRHKLDRHIFVPFDYLRRKCFWHSWAENKYPREFKTLSEWFQVLPSLFNQRMKLPCIEAEGLVFYHVDGVRMAKLRRDMFPWYRRGKQDDPRKHT